MVSKSLQREWDERLRASGFDDAEQSDGHLKIWHSQFFSVRYFRYNMTWPESLVKNNANSIVFQAKHDYYLCAERLLTTYNFESDLAKKVWELHQDGVAMHNIVKTLRNKGLGKIYADKVFNIITTIAKDIGKR